MSKKTELEERIFECIKTEPGVSAPQVAERFSISRVSAFRHLQTLISLQKVRTQGSGKATRYFPHELVSIGLNLGRGNTTWTSDQVQILKSEILFRLAEAYEESQTEE